MGGNREIVVEDPSSISSVGIPLFQIAKTHTESRFPEK